MGNTESTEHNSFCCKQISKDNKFVCSKCYKYWCSDHIIKHSCFDNNLSHCKLCPFPIEKQCKKCDYYYCTDHILLHNPCITKCKKCIYAITYCSKCNINISKYV